MIKDVMVHLDGTPEDGARLGHALARATAFGNARVTGLYTNALPEYAYVIGAQSGVADIGPLIELEERVRQEGDETVALLQQRLDRPGAAHEVRRVEAWPSLIPELCVSQARWADIFIATTPYRESGPGGWDRMVETVLFGSGHGVYLVPPGCPVRGDLRSVLVAWKDTVGAARAVAEAMPFLRAATRVTLLAVESGTPEGLGEQTTDLAAHLDRHGVAVEVKNVRGPNDQVGDILRGEAAKMSADLVVMGAYGHSRLREWILGGATRDMVERSDIPLLLAH